MQRGVTIVIATIWLLVSVAGTGEATLNPSYLALDQYSPLPARRLQAYQGVDSDLDWKDQDDRSDDQPLELSVGPRKSIPFHGSSSESSLQESQTDISSLERTKSSESLDNSKFSHEMIGDKNRKLQRQDLLLHEKPPEELEDPFVADDTFEDQGPGSVEVYKFDLFKEKALLGPTTAKTIPKSKSKVPKKTSHTNWKEKSLNFKITSPVILDRQSNFFDELQTDVPLNSETFGVGGVPELQVGCEGLEASSHKLKRSIDSIRKEKNPQSQGSTLFDVTPISIDLDYELSSEEGYEEMDELVKLKKLQATTKKPKQNRGDMDAMLHDTEFLNNKNRPEKLPVRGDLGKSGVSIDLDHRPPAFILNNHTTAQDVQRLTSDDPKSNRGRKLLWTEDPVNNAKSKVQSRLKRSVWGYGEEEGVITSDELKTENQRRRQFYERMLEEKKRRGSTQDQSKAQIQNIRDEYDRMLEERNRQEEKWRRHEHDESTQGVLPSRWREEDERQREQRRREHEEHLRRMQYQPSRRFPDRTWANEDQTKQEPLRENTYRPAPPTQEVQSRQRSHEDQERRREHQRLEAERRRKEHEEARRRFQEEQSRQRAREGEERRKDEDRRRQENNRQPVDRSSDNNLSLGERRTFEERQKEWMTKLRQREEEERKRQERLKNQPSNLVHRHQANTSDTRGYYSESERRMREYEERERDQKLREYIQRNSPINVTRSTSNRRVEAEGRRFVSRGDPHANITRRESGEESTRRDEQRRRQEEQRRIEEEQMRRRDPRRREEEQRRREEEQRRWEEEQRRREEEQRRASEEHRRKEEMQRRAKDPRRVEEEQRRKEEEQRRWEEEQRRREEVQRQNRRYQNYDRRNQSFESINTKAITVRPSYDYYRHRGTEVERRIHGPSPPMNNPRSYTDEPRRRQDVRRLEDEKRQREQDELKKEMLRREEEVRRANSRRYQEDRKRQEAIRLEAERRRKEFIEEQSRRSHPQRTWPMENTRTEYEDHRFQEHRRRQDTSLIPGNLLLDENRRVVERERQRQEHERRRIETDRQRQEEDRIKQARQREDYDRAVKEQQRRQEEARLNALPVSARIIVRPGTNIANTPPKVTLRTGFGNEIDFLGLNPHRPGPPASKYPAPPTPRPPAQSPAPCVWAVVQCCPTNKNRMVPCFESMGCPGINWDPNPCRGSIIKAARDEIARFYANGEKDDPFS